MSLGSFFSFKKTSKDLKSPKDIVLFLTDEKTSSSERDRYLDELIKEPKLFMEVVEELTQLSEKSLEEGMATARIMKEAANLCKLHLKDEPSGKHLDPSVLVTLAIMEIKNKEIAKRCALQSRLREEISNKISAALKHISTP